ncbi:ABC-2 family transporter permease [Nocardiopsis potens]|uniref:hypothetical protein n=1 Tax=Nocardiopsis potens TaxID=1246458 RepID=UPI0003453222|nr:hypothetical protein [Nocardiopsis potens]
MTRPSAPSPASEEEQTVTAATARPGPQEPVRDDPSLAAVFAVELGRLRTGLPFWLTVLLPVVLVLPLGLISAASPEGRAGALWQVWFGVVLMFWGTVQPMAAAVYAAASVRADRGARRIMYGYAFPRHRLLLGKYAALLTAGLCGSALLILLLSAAAVLLGSPEEAVRVVPGVLVPWLGGAATLALCLAVAERWGFAATAGTGVAGMLLSALAGDAPFWWALPPVWPMRAVVPLAGVEASGVPLQPGDPLHSTAVLPAVVALSVLVAAVLLAVGARHVDRKEI